MPHDGQTAIGSAAFANLIGRIERRKIHSPLAADFLRRLQRAPPALGIRRRKIIGGQRGRGQRHGESREEEAGKKRGLHNGNLTANSAEGNTDSSNPRGTTQGSDSSEKRTGVGVEEASYWS